MRVLPSALATALVSVLLAAAPVSAVPPPEPRTAVVAENQVTRVVVISVDGLNPDAITQLGRSGAPTFHRIVDEGATTFNARSEVEMTNTLPNHTGMVTSRRIDLPSGGHGVTWNDDRLVPRTVQVAAGQRVGSVFSSLEAAGLSSSMFAAKGKFDLFNRSWPNGVDHILIRGNNTKLVKAARRDLRTTSRALTFLHISLPDVAGHHHGWFSPAYMDAVRESDYLIGQVLKTIGRSAESRDHTMVVRDGRPRRLGTQPPRPATVRQLPGAVPRLGCRTSPPAPTSTRSTRRTPTPARPGSGTTPRASPSATATSATWSSTCSACRRSPTASTTTPRTSRSSP